MVSTFVRQLQFENTYDKARAQETRVSETTVDVPCMPGSLRISIHAKLLSKWHHAATLSHAEVA